LIVRLLFVLRVASIACIAAASGGQAFACKCMSNYHGKSNWEAAKLETDGSAAIFEGTPEHFELMWSLLSAKPGELIATETEGPNPAEWPKMMVTFRVQRAYKGDSGPEIKIKTGLGGGDCGAVFAPGLTYLVFADRSPSGVLGVSMCSPGGWIAGTNAAVELRYLRKERPIASDLTLQRRWNAKEYAAQEEERTRDFEEYQERYAAVTGEICGNVAAEKAKDGNEGILSFLFSGGFSPYAHPTANINSDGSFCSGRLGPGKYFLYFTRHSEEGPTLAAYYPGVRDREKASIIEINAGQIQSGITFKVPDQQTYSVRGFLSIYDSLRTGPHSAYIELVNLDAVPFPVGQRQRIDFESSSAFPKIKYFDFERLLPGRYTAYISGLGLAWYAKKEEVNVTNHMKFISLELVRQK
jgi:hypothetical protein